MSQSSLSVIISAYNEEEHIAAAIASAAAMLEGRIADFELLVFDDGSRDKTGEVADQVAGQYPFVRVTHNPGNKGISFIAREGIRMASKEYITWFPGDNSIEAASMLPVIEAIGKADIIVAYMANRNERSLFRRILSVVFTTYWNVLFGLKLRYYNGASVYPAKLLKSLNITSNGYEFFAEMLIRAVRSGSTYTEVPFVHKIDPTARSKAFTLRNFLSIIKTSFVLVRDIHFRQRNKELRFHESRT